jgi:hypothetical protein
VTGLSRAEYLSLIAAVDLVLDPVTEDGGGLETALLPTLEALMIGTPVVTLRPDEDVRGWDRMQPTSSAAGVIQAVGGDAMASRCVAHTPQRYAVLAAALLAPENRSAHVAMCVRGRVLTQEWLEEQNAAVGAAWVGFLQRVGRPYADWRGRVKLEVAAEEKEKKK